jgi:hypothetical protein
MKLSGEIAFAVSRCAGWDGAGTLRVPALVPWIKE